MTKMIFNEVLQKADKEFMLPLIPFTMTEMGNVCQGIPLLYLTGICRKLIFVIFMPLS